MDNVVKKMKIALVHDYLKEYGGAERVLETLHEIWPEAPIFTTVYLPEFLGPHRDRSEKWDIRPSILQRIPFKEKLISPFRIIAPFIFRSLDLWKYDVVIVSATGAYSSNLITKGKAIQICYCHTPPRYLYGYRTAREWKKYWPIRILAEISNHFLRILDFKSAQNVDYFVANSKEVAARIKKYYCRDAKVIYPPVEIQTPDVAIEFNIGCGLASHIGGGGYFLAGGRLAKPKRVDLAIVACTKIKLPLKVFGKEFAGYGEELKKIAGPNVEFLGEITDEEKWRLMAGAKAFIFPAEEEDFGITPVEAMAAGTPVIAYRSGGVVESVIEGKTGVFFDPPSRKASEGRGEPTVESLVRAIKKFEKMEFKPKDCIRQARKFSKERFKSGMRKFVENVYLQRHDK